MATSASRFFEPTSDGELTVELGEHVRELIGNLAQQLRELLMIDESADLARLYPTAYPDDPDQDAFFQQMVHDQLLMSRLEGIDTVERTLRSELITADEADAWMGTINQLRLVIGTRLDVSEDDAPIEADDPQRDHRVIYQALSHILEDLTEARGQLL